MELQILCSMKRENVCQKIKDTTYDMSIQNQSYRQAYLSKCVGGKLCISRAGASMDGGGLEMLCMQIYEDGEGSVLEGGFEILPHIKIANKAFIMIALAGCLPFILSKGAALAAGLCMIPWIVFLYKTTLHACVSEEGRNKVIDYIREVLEVKCMGYIFKTDTSENIYDIYYQNKWRLGEIKEAKWNAIEENKSYHLQLYNENGDFISIYIRQALDEEDIVKEVNLILKDLKLHQLDETKAYAFCMRTDDAESVR